MKNFRFYLMSIVALFALCMFLGCEEDGPTGCIAEGSFVATPTGEKLIENLQVGDVVYSYDVATQKLQTSKVLFIKKSYQPCYQFSVSEKNKLVATKTHPIYSPQTGKYERAEKWVDKELTDFAFVKQNQNFISLSSNSVLQVGKKVVYDITVASPHANFIANGFLVHNKPPQPTNTGPIEDLEVISKTDSSLTLSWSALGNNALYAMSYDMRISDSGFNFNNLALYDSVANMPSPRKYGERDTVEIIGLQSQKSYWFIMRAFSNENEFSTFGNIVVDTTL